MCWAVFFVRITDILNTRAISCTQQSRKQNNLYKLGKGCEKYNNNNKKLGARVFHDGGVACLALYFAAPLERTITRRKHGRDSPLDLMTAVAAKRYATSTLCGG